MFIKIRLVRTIKKTVWPIVELNFLIKIKVSTFLENSLNYNI